MSIIRFGDGQFRQLEANVPVEVTDSSVVTAVTYAGVAIPFTTSGANFIILGQIHGNLTTGTYNLVVTENGVDATAAVPYTRTHPITAPTGAYDPLSLWAQIRTATAAYFKAAPLPAGNSWVAPHTGWTTANSVLPIANVISGPKQTLSAESLNANGSVVGSSYDTVYVPQSSVTDLVASTISSTEVALSWTGVGGFTYNPRYRRVGDVTWTTLSAVSRVEDGQLTTTATGLAPAEDYEFDLTASEASSNAATATTAPASGIVDLPAGGFGGGATFNLPLYIDHTVITGVTYNASAVTHSVVDGVLTVTIPSSIGVGTYDFVIVTESQSFTYPVVYVQLTPFAASTKLATVAADGRYPGLSLGIPRALASAQVGVTDLAVTTTETSATLTFTPVPGAKVYLFQYATDNIWRGDKYSDGSTAKMEFTGLTAGLSHQWRMFADGVVSNVVVKATATPSGGAPAGAGSINTTPPDDAPGVRILTNPEYVYTDNFEGARDTAFWTRIVNAGRGNHLQTPGTTGARTHLFHMNMPGTPIGVDGQDTVVSGDHTWSEAKFKIPINAVQLQISYDLFIPTNFKQGAKGFKGFATLWSGTYGGSNADQHIILSWIGAQMGAQGGPTPMMAVGTNGFNKGGSYVKGVPKMFPNYAGRWYRVDIFVECAKGPGLAGRIDCRLDGNLIIGTHHPQLHVPTYVNQTGPQLLSYGTKRNYFSDGYIMGWLENPQSGGVKESYKIAVDNFRLAANSSFGSVSIT